MSLIRRSIGFVHSDLGLRFVAEAAARGSGFVVTPLLAWTLGAAVFGGYTQILSLSFAFVPIVSLGLGYTVIRKVAKAHDNECSFSLLFSAIVIVSLLCLLLAALLATFHSKLGYFLPPELVKEPFLVVIGVSFLAWVVATEALVQEYFRALKWVRRSLSLQLSVLAWHLICLVTVLFLGHLSIWSALAVLVFAKLSVIAVVLSVLFRLQQPGDRKINALREWRVLFAGLPFMLAGFAEWAGNLGDRLIVGKYLGAEYVAQYTAAIMLLSVIVALGSPLWWLLFPELVKYKRQENYELCLHIVQQRTMTFVKLALPALFLIILVANPAISLLVNSSAADMSFVVFLLGLAVFLNQLATGWEYFVVTVSSGKRLMSATIISALIGFVLAIYLGPIWGISGIAFAALIGKVILAITYAILANKVGYPGFVWKTAELFAITAMNLIAFGMVSVLVPLFNLHNPAGVVLAYACLFGLSYATMYFIYAKLVHANG